LTVCFSGVTLSRYAGNINDVDLLRKLVQCLLNPALLNPAKKFATASLFIVAVCRFGAHLVQESRLEIRTATINFFARRKLEGACEEATQTLPTYIILSLVRYNANVVATNLNGTR
jgi:putative intracellular protease/amidase